MRVRNRWGWGFEDAATRRAMRAPPRRASSASSASARPSPRSPSRPRRSRCRRRACVPAAPARDLHGRRRASAPATPAGSRTSTPSAACAAGTPTCPTSSRAHATVREIEAVLEWAGGANAAVVPYGGGTSVVGGVEPRIPDRFDGAVTIDLQALDRVREIDPVSRAARIGAGASGPRIEEQLAAHGLTLRFFPQSFELSTLGGWIATRAGGHFATHLTHIDDLVESVRAVGPTGHWVSRRLPGSGAGPSPDRLLLGSEGILGAHHRGVGPGPPAPGPPRGAGGRVRVVPRRRRGGPCARAVRARAGELPAHRRARGGADRRRRRARGAAHARLRVRRPSRRRLARPRARDLSRARRALRRAGGDQAPRLVARGVPAHAVPARPARAPRRLHRHVRVGGDVGALPGVPRLGHRRGRGRRSASRAASRAASRTSTPTARRRTSPSSPPRAAARRRRSGTR